VEVYWIGGVTCSGKSTLARILAARYKLLHYEADEHFERHARHASKQTQPTMYAFQHDREWDRWARTLRGAARAELWLCFYRERFASIIADLEAVQKPVVAEGVDLLPETVDGVGQGARGAWLVPTRAFYERRERAISDEGWGYYQFMCEHVRRQVQERGLSLFEIDGSVDSETLADALTQPFFLSAAD
jgi:hypothetical protein